MDTIRVERDTELPGLVTVTLNRPHKLNAINFTMQREVLALCRDLQDDAEARVVIFTGEGRAFSAGADLGRRKPGDAPSVPSPAPAAIDPMKERTGATLGNRSSAAIEAVPQVTIGAVNGLAVGGAVVWLSCMDMRVAASSAWFSIPEIALDIPLTWNALPRLVRELGPARTKELVMTCDRFSAEDALRWGFVNHVVPDAELLPRARALAKSLLEKDALSVAATKSTVNALANLMVPADGTHSDPDYLLLAWRLQRERRQ